MYLTDISIENCGPIQSIYVHPSFHSNGNPKPLVLVGGNGSGKTNVLSIIADALVEIASTSFRDVSSYDGSVRSYYRLLGPATTAMGAQYELSAAVFAEGDQQFTYRASSGAVPAGHIETRLPAVLDLRSSIEPGNVKTSSGEAKIIERIFREGAYFFSPSNRSEVPAWAASGSSYNDPPASFRGAIGGRLNKPLVVESSILDIKSWLIDIIVDSTIDSAEIYNLARKNDIQQILKLATEKVLNSRAISNIHKVLGAIMQFPNARLARAGRWAGQRKIMLEVGEGRYLPSLDALSSGQAALLSIFGTILRYGDSRNVAEDLSNITGIVIVDEIDAHLHSDLQHDVLPALIKLFPRIQFIVSSHAPLFPLGMERELGVDGYTLIELPTGASITPERFEEFEKSYAYFKSTKLFEAEVEKIATESTRPIVLCEGETDPMYIRAAAGLLGFQDIIDQIDLDYMGKRREGGAVGSGQSALDAVRKLYKLNPSILTRKTVLLYDFDAGRSADRDGNLWVMSCPFNSENGKCTKGIENLLPEGAITEQFYRVETKTNGFDEITYKKLQKLDLAKHICIENPVADNFQNFGVLLQGLREALIGN